MRKHRTTLSGNKKLLALVIVAAILLVFSSIQATRAALTYFSEDYVAGFEIRNIGITLYENDKAVSWRDGYNGEQSSSEELEEIGWNKSNTEDEKLLQNMLEETNGTLILNHKYKEELKISNSAEINQYARVMVYKRWLRQDPDSGEWVADTTLDPALIDINILSGKGTNWIEDKDAKTPERTVLYYKNILEPGEESTLFADTLTIKGGIAYKVDELKEEVVEGNKKTTVVKYIYTYDDVKFELIAEADAVQTHNAVEAIKSAWGIDVNIGADKTLSLAN